jgi:hypothetical protein
MPLFMQFNPNFTPVPLHQKTGLGVFVIQFQDGRRHPSKYHCATHCWNYNHSLETPVMEDVICWGWVWPEVEFLSKVFGRCLCIWAGDYSHTHYVVCQHAEWSGMFYVGLVLSGRVRQLQIHNASNTALLLILCPTHWFKSSKIFHECIISHLWNVYWMSSHWLKLK